MGSHGATLTIYDRQGGEVIKLEGDSNKAIWDGRNAQGQIVAAGTYLVVLKSGDKIQKKKIVIYK